jgi:hypothetical protein
MADLLALCQDGCDQNAYQKACSWDGQNEQEILKVEN